MAASSWDKYLSDIQKSGLKPLTKDTPIDRDAFSDSTPQGKEVTPGEAGRRWASNLTPDVTALPEEKGFWGKFFTPAAEALKLLNVGSSAVYSGVRSNLGALSAGFEALGIEDWNPLQIEDDGRNYFEVFADAYNNGEGFGHLINNEVLELDDTASFLERLPGNVAGFALDVGLDPTTYVSGGTSVLGKAALKGVSTSFGAQSARRVIAESTDEVVTNAVREQAGKIIGRSADEVAKMTDDALLENVNKFRARMGDRAVEDVAYETFEEMQEDLISGALRDVAYASRMIGTGSTVARSVNSTMKRWGASDDLIQGILKDADQELIGGIGIKTAEGWSKVTSGGVRAIDRSGVFAMTNTLSDWYNLRRLRVRAAMAGPLASIRSGWGADYADALRKASARIDAGEELGEFGSKLDNIELFRGVFSTQKSAENAAKTIKVNQDKIGGLAGTLTKTRQKLRRAFAKQGVEDWIADEDIILRHASVKEADDNLISKVEKLREAGAEVPEVMQLRYNDAIGRRAAFEEVASKYDPEVVESLTKAMNDLIEAKLELVKKTGLTDATKQFANRIATPEAIQFRREQGNRIFGASDFEKARTKYVIDSEADRLLEETGVMSDKLLADSLGVDEKEITELMSELSDKTIKEINDEFKDKYGVEFNMFLDDAVGQQVAVAERAIASLARREEAITFAKSNPWMSNEKVAKQFENMVDRERQQFITHYEDFIVQTGQAPGSEVLEIIAANVEGVDDFTRAFNALLGPEFEQAPLFSEFISGVGWDLASKESRLGQQGLDNLTARIAAIVDGDDAAYAATLPADVVADIKLSEMSDSVRITLAGEAYAMLAKQVSKEAEEFIGTFYRLADELPEAIDGTVVTEVQTKMLPGLVDESAEKAAAVSAAEKTLSDSNRALTTAKNRVTPRLEKKYDTAKSELKKLRRQRTKANNDLRGKRGAARTKQQALIDNLDKSIARFEKVVDRYDDAVARVSQAEKDVASAKSALSKAEAIDEAPIRRIPTEVQTSRILKTPANDAKRLAIRTADAVAEDLENLQASVIARDVAQALGFKDSDRVMQLIQSGDIRDLDEAIAIFENAGREVFEARSVPLTMRQQTSTSAQDAAVLSAGGYISKDQYRETVQDVIQPAPLLDLTTYDSAIAHLHRIREITESSRALRSIANDTRVQPIDFADPIDGVVVNAPDFMKKLAEDGWMMGEGLTSAIKNQHKFVKDKKSGTFMQTHDMLLTVFRTYATVGQVGPSFHLRNTIGAIANNIAAGVRPSSMARGRELSYSATKVLNELREEGVPTGEFADVLEERVLVALTEKGVKNPEGGANLVRRAYEEGVLQSQTNHMLEERATTSVMLKANGKVDFEAIAADAYRRRAMLGQPEDLERWKNMSAYYRAVEAGDDEAKARLKRYRPSKSEIAQARVTYGQVTNNKYIQMSSSIGQHVEHALRMGAFVEGYARFGSAEGGSLMAKAIHFDYQDLNSFERRIAKRLLPFYVWQRNNIPLQMRLILNRPGRLDNLYDLQTAMQEAMGDDDIDERLVPEWAQGKLGFFANIPFLGGPGTRTIMRLETPMLDLTEWIDPIITGEGNPLGGIQAMAGGISPMFKAANTASSMFTGVGLDLGYGTVKSFDELEPGESQFDHIVDNLIKGRQGLLGIGGPLEVGVGRALSLPGSAIEATTGVDLPGVEKNDWKMTIAKMLAVPVSTREEEKVEKDAYYLEMNDRKRLDNYLNDRYESASEFNDKVSRADIRREWARETGNIIEAGSRPAGMTKQEWDTLKRRKMYGLD